MRVQITVDGTVLDASIEDHPSARDFAAMLPLELAARDFAGSEKIADLPRRLSTAHSAARVDPAPGDLYYYSPWGNLAIYYRAATWSEGLVRLGRIDGPIAALTDQNGEFTITIAPAD
jgi:hypothetical protein